MALTDRMKEARTRKGLTQEKLAREIGVAKSTYTGYEKGNSEPNMLVLSRIMKALDVDANFLFQDDVAAFREIHATPDEMEHLVKKYRSLDDYGKEAVDNVLDVEWRRCKEEEDKKKKLDEVKKQREKMEAAEEMVYFITPGFLSPMSAGTGQPAGSEYPENYRLIKEPPRGTSYIAPISGDSMEPTFHDGDKLFIRACTEINTGQIGVFYMDGQQWVKELGDGVLLSHNPKYDPKEITEDCRCQGLVLGVCDESYFE